MQSIFDPAVDRESHETSNLQELFESCQVLFDEAIQRLPASAKLLTHIKCEYDRVLWKLQKSKSDLATRELQRTLQATQLTTISNYYNRIQDLEVKLENLNTANGKIRLDMEAMRVERERMLVEYEEQAQLLNYKAAKSSSKVCYLKLSISDAVSISSLREQLKAVEDELAKVKAITEKKYVSTQKKTLLQDKLKQKENFRTKINSENKKCSLILKKLNISIQAVQSYLLYLQSQQIGQSEYPLEKYIKAVLGGVEDDSSSEEEFKDPAVGMEAEMIMYSYETFYKLFEAERYQEAALHAATSPNGILRTLSTVHMFRDSAHHHFREKSPLLCYIEYLLLCAPAYMPIGLQESIECTKCLLELREVSKLTHWIAQGSMPASVEIGTMISESCSCSNLCRCGYRSLAFTVFEQCRAHQQASMCLILQGHFISFLSYATKAHMTKQDCEEILCSAPSVALVLALTFPPLPHQPFLTIFEVMRLLLVRGSVSEKGNIVMEGLHAYLKQLGVSLTQSVMEDDKTETVVWHDLLTLLQDTGQGDMAIELLSLLTVKKALSQTVEQIKCQRQEGNTLSSPDYQSQQQPSSSDTESPTSPCSSGGSISTNKFLDGHKNVYS